jgi:type III pantothenate kinase
MILPERDIMILTVDVGNTLIKIGAWDGDKLVFVARLQALMGRTKDEYAIDILNMIKLNGCQPEQFDGAIIASVVPALTLAVRRAVEMIVRSGQVLAVCPGIKTGLNIKIDNPATLGADIVCASVAAIAKYPLPCIVISLGTATVVFALDKNGGYLGGTVCAGISISLEALSEKTAQLPYINLETSAPPVIGSNVVDAIRSGAMYGTADMLDGMVRRMQEIIGQSSVVACGGIAEHIIPHCSRPITLDQNIVLDGLRII